MKASSILGSERRHLARAVALVALVVALLVARSSAASPTSAEVEAARSAFAEGLALEGQNRWSDALDRFDRAAAVRTSPQISFHRGLCLEHTGRLVDALDAFVRAERGAVGDASARRVGTLAARHVEALRARIPAVVLHAPPEGAPTTVLLDGHPLTTAILEVPLPVDPGDHTISSTLPGHVAVEARITARTGDRIDVALLPGAEVAPPAPVDAPPRPTDAPPASAPLRAPTRDAAPPRSSPAMSPAAPSGKWIVTPAIEAGVGLAAFGAAGVLYALRASAISDLRAACGSGVCPDDLRSTRDRGQNYTIAGNVALGVGIAATAAAAVTLIVLRPRAGRAVTVSSSGPFLFVRGAL